TSGCLFARRSLERGGKRGYLSYINCNFLKGRTTLSLVIFIKLKNLNTTLKEKNLKF
ncbi:hypothetical protein ALC56_01197, partial [Trachymyrmex septentrionalis]